MPTPTPGALVGGKYQILRAVGEGGMGTVYEAEHVLTQKRAAIKWVHPQPGAHNAARERLLHEARATSRIRHRNVVDVYDVLCDDAAVCLVMELLVGEPLSDRILRSPLSIFDFIALLLPAMRGVAAAHRAGVVHRDIKPDNMFLAREPGQDEVVPKVIDFGISKIFEPRGGRANTHSGITMGTPRYVSYEQLLGARDVDARTDVYAFGVILYEALTGESPYRASTFGEQAVAFAMSVPVRASELRPEVPPALDELVFRAIAKERDARIPTMQAFIEALEPFAKAEAFEQPWLAFSESPRPSGAPQLHAVTVRAGRERAAESVQGARRQAASVASTGRTRLRKLLPALVAACVMAVLVWVWPRSAAPRVSAASVLAPSLLETQAEESEPLPSEPAKPVADAVETGLVAVQAPASISIHSAPLESHLAEPKNEAERPRKLPAPRAVSRLSERRPAKSADVQSANVLPDALPHAAAGQAAQLSRAEAPAVVLQAGDLKRDEF